MDFDQALAAHTRWKVTLRRALEEGTRLDAELVRRDDACELGRWLHGEGARHSGLAAFAQLREVHARFHLAAAAVAQHINAGQRHAAELQMGAGSELAQLSVKVATALRRCRLESAGSSSDGPDEKGDGFAA